MLGALEPGSGRRPELQPLCSLRPWFEAAQHSSFLPLSFRGRLKPSTEACARVPWGPSEAHENLAQGGGEITLSGRLLTACLSGFFPVRSVTFKSTSPTPCSAACMGRSAPFPWRQGSTSHSPTSPRTARASSSACPGTDAQPVGPRLEPGALPLSSVGPHLIADPCCRPIEISSQGSCWGRSPSLPSLRPLS